MRKAVIILVVLLGGVAVLLGGAFLFREDLVRYGAGRFLSDGQLTLTRLQGLDVTSTQLAIAELEFLLNESGQRLVIAGLDVDYRITSVSTAPVVDSITIASAQLSGAAGAVEPEADGDTPGFDTPLSEILTLLREFPLSNIFVADLRLPQRSEAFSVQLQRGDSGLTLTTDSGALHLQAQFTQVDPAAVAQFDVTLRRNELTVGDLEITLQPRDDVYEVTGRGTLEIDDLNALLGELEQAPLPIPLRSAHLELDVQGALSDTLEYGDGAFPAVVVKLQPGSRLTLPAELASGLGEVTLEFTDAVELNILYAGAWTVDKSTVPLHVTSSWREQPVDVSAILTVLDCAIPPGAGCELAFDGNASFGAYTLAGVIEAAASDSYHIKTQGLTLGGLPELVPAFDIDAKIAVDGELVTFSTPLLVRSTPADAGITLDGTYDLAASTANVHVVLPELNFTEQGGALSDWFSNWPYTFDVLAGALDAEADLTWQAGALTGMVAGNLKDLGGFYGDYFFGGVNGALQAGIDTAGELPVNTPPLMLSAATIDIGLLLEDVNVAFSLEPTGALHIESVVAHVLDGTISGAGITYDPNRERNDILVKFDGLQMERMLDLVEYEGIEATGAVSGEVPLTVTPNGVEVAAGILTADAPGGSIRYRAAATGASGNAGLDLVNQALSNYQFSSLTSDVTYSPDGELVLAMKLQGGNPDMSGGQRINLNLNLTDNIPALLESLQAAREIEDFLAEQYE
jgi:hypothetical protein